MPGSRILLAGVLALVTACAGGAGGDEVTVLAASSLTDALGEVVAAFEAEHGDVRVRLAFGASSALREQIAQGAPADVFAAAAPGPMADLADAGLVADVASFATNRLQVAVPEGNPAGVAGIEDLARDDLLVGLCAPEVPCGSLAARVLREVGVRAAADTEEPDARALLTKLAEGELDAGLVYATDVLAADGRVEGVDLPGGVDATTAYPVAVVGDAPDAAHDLVAFLLAAEGQAILRAHGFGAP